jgi:hypothetical protein
MRAAVDEENIAAASAGQAVKMTLYSFPGRTFDGVVGQKYPEADAARRTFDVDVKFAKPDARLQAGMTGELAFIEQTRDRALIVPAQAVQNGVVWLARDGRLARADATLGIRSIERVEVIGGLKPGDLVVISPLVEPVEGGHIRVATTVDPKDAADLNKPKETQLFNAFKQASIANCKLTCADCKLPQHSSIRTFVPPCVGSSPSVICSRTSASRWCAWRG